MSRPVFARAISRLHRDDRPQSSPPAWVSAAAVAAQITGGCIGVLAATACTTVLVALTQSDSFTEVFVATTAALVPALLAGTVALYVAAVLGFVTARLLIRLERQTRVDERVFIQRASHQLRTPLARVNTRLQLLERAGGMDRALAELRRDTDLLIEAVDDVLRDSDPRAPRTHFKS